MAKVLNRSLFREAKRYIAGGVNSPVRSFRAVGGHPVFIKSARGSRLYGEDGSKFIDYCLSWGAIILGHAYPPALREVKRILNYGTSFGAPTRLETELARLIVEAVPSIEKVRLTNSGTEAVMSAIRLARAFTGRDKIIKFEGSYHGHADYLLACAGVPKDFSKHTIVLKYNDIEGVKEALAKRHDEVAAVIVEPVAANMGVVLPREGFLEALRKLTLKYGVVLIFDEVITGFRVSYRGAQGRFGVKPDLTCLGKIIGGGLASGAFGGRADIMRLIAPQGSVYQAGTLSGNPVAVSAGIATLRALKKIDYYTPLEQNTEWLCESLRAGAEDFRLKININHIASIFSIFFTDKDVVDYKTAGTQDARIFKKFFHGLLKNGIYLSPSGFEANFLSAAHSIEDLKMSSEAIRKTFKELKEV